MKFAFIILQYNTTAQTERCLDAILARVTGYDFRIALLDNGSGDASCRKLVEERFSNLLRGGVLLFIESQANLGFAGGNNMMFEKLNQSGFVADFYVFLNNDVYIVSNDFCQQIQNAYATSAFSLLGPRIILGNNRIDECPFSLPTARAVRSEIGYWKSVRNFSALHLIRPFLFGKRLSDFIRKIAGKTAAPIDKSEPKEHVLLHGACLVFARQYFAVYGEPFDPRTFLYKEEELLMLRLRKKKLRSVFEPNLIVFHEGGASTVKDKNINQVFAFRARHYLKSLKVLLAELEDDLA